MKKKGLELVTLAQIGFIFTIGIVAFLLLFGFQNYINLSAIVTENIVERHAVVIANVLLSSEKIAVSESKTLSRGVFDFNKLSSITSEEIQKQIGFPNSIAFIGIEDLESGKIWSFSLQGPTNIPALVSFSDCFSKIKIDISIIFRIPPVSPWTSPDLFSCFVSKISRQGSSIVSYPVIIKDGESIHLGRMVVTLMEFGLT